MVKSGVESISHDHLVNNLLLVFRGRSFFESTSCGDG